MAMDDKDGWIWFDGALKPWREAATHVLTHTLHYGLGVFEGLRAYDTARGPAIFRLAEHTRRLMHSAHILGIELPFGQAALERAQIEVVRANHLRNGYIRPLAFLVARRRAAAAAVAMRAIPLHDLERARAERNQGFGNAEEQRAQSGEMKTGWRGKIIRQHDRDARRAGKLAEVVADSVGAGGVEFVQRRDHGRVLAAADQELGVAVRKRERRARKERGKHVRGDEAGGRVHGNDYRR